MEAGDSLFYSLETSGITDSFFDASFSDSSGTRSRREAAEYKALRFGETEIRIWRHEPGLVGGVKIINGESSFTKDRNKTEPTPDFQDEFYSDSSFEVFFEIDFFESSSSIEHELEGELDMTKHIDFGEDNGCLKCSDNGFNIPILREMPIISQTHETFIASEIGGEPLIINGFNYIVEVEELRVHI